MKYTGRWSVNNGSTYNYGYESNNKYKLARKMKEIAKGNLYQGSGRWSVFLYGDTSGQAVLEGTVYNK
jgi:hypothetical protein